METTNTQVTTPAGGGWSRHCAGQGTPGRSRRQRGLFIAALIAAAATLLALGQHWLAAADLVPLLFLLPCAVMMFMCAKGNQQQADPSPASSQGGTPTITDTRN